MAPRAVALSLAILVSPNDDMSVAAASVLAAAAGVSLRNTAALSNLHARSNEMALSDTSVTHTESGTRLVRETGTTMEDIVSRIERVTEVVAQIRNGAREQSAGVSQINTAVTELDGATQHNAAMVEQTSAAAVQMREQADQLQALLASFRLSSDTGSQTIVNDAAPTGPENSHAGFGRTAGGAAA